LTRRLQPGWPVWRERVARALDTARQAQSFDAALFAGEVLCGLAERLRDDQADRAGSTPEAITALAEMGAALQQVNKLRLAQRRFVAVSDDEMVEELVQQDARALFERKYQGRFVRWKVKFKAKRDGDVFIANAGEHLEAACSMDPCVPEVIFERLEPWQVLTLEGRFADLQAFGNATDPRRARVVFDLCIVG
jgi:hypothetical protein